MEQRFEKILALAVVLLLASSNFSQIFAAQDSEQPEEIPGVSSLETLESLAQRFQSLSAGLNKIPDPPKLAGGTIQLPEMKRVEKSGSPKKVSN